MTTYFKVKEDKLVSQFIDVPGAIVGYKVGEWVYSNIPNSHLLVFNDLKDVKSYVLNEGIFALTLDRYEKYKVFECEIEDPITINRLSFGNYICMYRFWENDQQESIINAPRGTVGAKSVKLLTEINYDKVVKVIHGEYYSSFTVDLSVKYKVGEWTKPRGVANHSRLQ